MQTRIIRPPAAGLALLALAIAGCEPAAKPVASQIAGQWRGTIVTRTTQHAQATHEDFTLTILSDGRLETTLLIPTAEAQRVGQLLRCGQSAVRVLRADYGPTASYLVLESAGPPTDELLRSGWAVSAVLCPDDQLLFHLFSYALSAGSAGLSDAVAQFGMLRRVTATTQAE